ncbi:tRNA (adenosine(37)-N6)-threonylcarbamoyltransferase complex dimerization subunit type 1 TsaB [Algivirga pacifica]|uniref:tRNA (Adenosine(37)-N6)-threonylcarbamoyltransferase complex dimerization subunit type 1 TsaB n=1 Tax=Algivirga pacifica TaxID=1162670 RepID=A0ABP9DM74_9BACT
MILSIDTSTTVCSVALHSVDGALISFYELHLEYSHSEYLNQMIEQVLQNARLQMSDLAAIAISEGPGSYTGLRIGTATAKGLCYALDIPLIAVGTLEAMAKEVSPYYGKGTLLCPMIDARRMEVYTALYDHTLHIVKEVHPKVMEEGAFAQEMEKYQLVYFGNGAEKCQPILSTGNSYYVKDIVPSAKQIGILAVEKFKKEDFKDVAYFEPFYLKEFRTNPSKKNPLGKR